MIEYKYAILLGLIGMLIADHYFPLLERHAFFVTAVGVCFAPVVYHVVSVIRKRLADDLSYLQRAYLTAGALVALIAVLMACNGAFDHSPSTLVSTSLLHKEIVRGKSSASYTLAVRSWRPGRVTEELGVDAPTYRSASVERPIVVEMHRGAFGMAWYSRVLATPITSLHNRNATSSTTTPPGF